MKTYEQLVQEYIAALVVNKDSFRSFSTDLDLLTKLGDPTSKVSRHDLTTEAMVGSRPFFKPFITVGKDDVGRRLSFLNTAGFGLIVLLDHPHPASIGNSMTIFAFTDTGKSAVEKMLLDMEKVEKKA